MTRKTDLKWRRIIRSPEAWAVGILLGALLGAVALLAAGKELATYAYVFGGAHLPLCAVEGLVTASAVVLMRKVRPELIEATLPIPSPLET